MTARGLLVPAVASFALLLASSAAGQDLYGADMVSGGLTQFPAAPGPPCNQPNAFRTICALTSGCPLVPPPQPTAGTILGDVATNKIRDTVFVTDGRVIHEYEGDRACGTPAPCTWVNGDFVPTFMGGLTGLGMDSRGGTYTAVGVPALWITDGALIAALIPSAPGSCLPFGVAVAPFAHGLGAGVILTDVSWDPSSGTLWCPDTGGFVHNILVGGGLAAGGTTLVVPGPCGSLTAPLTGLDVDTATPCISSGTALAYYVTDGAEVDYLDLTGAPAAPTFASPSNCTPTNGPLNGLAHTGHPVHYGFQRNVAQIGAFGQSTAPSPGFGIELRNGPLGSNMWLFVNSNFFPPGYACPPIFGVGTNFWINPPGWNFFYFGTVTSPCMAFNTPLPATFPPCLEIYAQWICTNSANTIALDATEGMTFIIQRP